LGYSSTNLLGTAASSGSGAVSTFGSSISRISTFVSDITSKRLYINGSVGAGDGSGVGDAGLIEADSSGRIGSSSAADYSGDISEVIIFNRGLKIGERNDIQEYLGKKYSINVTDSAS
jgi:hypothetical protein